MFITILTPFGFIKVTRLTVFGEDSVAVGHRVFGRHRAAANRILRATELEY